MPRTAKTKATVKLTRIHLSIGSFDLIRYCNFDHDFPRHAHDHYTFGVFETDVGSLNYRGASHRARAGCMLMVPDEAVHAAVPDRGLGWTYTAIYPSLSLIGMACEGLRTQPAAVTSPVIHDTRIARRLASLTSRLADGDASVEVEESTLTCIREMVSKYATSKRTPAQYAPSHDAVSIARDYINANFGRGIQLHDMAQAAGLSAYHLARCFRDRYGLPPHAYLTQVRASNARAMLLRGEAITGVAYRCGFGDQSHLTRVLRSIYGVTPGVYASAS